MQMENIAHNQNVFSLACVAIILRVKASKNESIRFFTCACAIFPDSSECSKNLWQESKQPSARLASPPFPLLCSHFISHQRLHFSFILHHQAHSNQKLNEALISNHSLVVRGKAKPRIGCQHHGGVRGYQPR